MRGKLFKATSSQWRNLNNLFQKPAEQNHQNNVLNGTVVELKRERALPPRASVRCMHEYSEY